MATDNDLLTQFSTAIIRFDSKLDNVINTLARLESNHHDHELRLRLIEAAYATRAQLKEVADTPTVSPGTMWKVAGILGTAFTFLFTVIAFLITTLR